jgi:5-methylcytosine-specific restriction endonuclease McrA
MLNQYQKPKHTMRLSKRNIFLRDAYTCQYCGTTVTEVSATLDHVLPVSKGGKTTWENSATACKSCNYKKAAHVGKMKPKITPYKPTFWDLVGKRRDRGYHFHHPSWSNYLG